MSKNKNQTMKLSCGNTGDGLTVAALPLIKKQSKIPVPKNKFRVPLKKQEKELLRKADNIMSKIMDISRKGVIEKAREEKYKNCFQPQMADVQEQILDFNLNLPGLSKKFEDMFENFGSKCFEQKEKMEQAFNDVKDSITELFPKITTTVVAAMSVVAIIYIVKKVLPKDRLKAAALLSGMTLIATSALGDAIRVAHGVNTRPETGEPIHPHGTLMFFYNEFIREIKDLFGLSTVCDWIKTKCSGPPPAESQAINVTSFDLPFGKATMTFLFSAIMSVVGLTGKHELKSSSFYVKFIHSWVKMEKFGSSIMEIATFIVGKITDLLSWLKVKFLGGNSFKLRETQFEDVNKWCDAVQKVCTDIHLAKKPINIETGDELWNLKMRGLNLLSADYGNSQVSAQVKGVITSTMQALTKSMAPFENLHIVGGGPRIEPVAIMLSGKTGIGKSLATYRLLIELLTRTLPADQLEAFQEHFESFVYVRESEGKYWTGYHGQWATIFDDFGAARDTCGVPDNEFFDFLRCINPFPHYCNMADLGSKGNVLFRSKFVLATCNRASYTPNSMTNPEAFARRGLKFHMELKREYAEQWTSYNSEVGEFKLSRHVLEQSNGYNPDWHEFQPIDESGHAVGCKMSFDQFVEFIIEEYKTKQVIAEKYILDLKTTSDNLIRERRFQVQPQADVMGEDTDSDSSDEAIDEFEERLFRARFNAPEDISVPINEASAHEAIQALLEGVSSDDLHADSDSEDGSDHYELAPDYDEYDADWASFKENLFSRPSWRTFKRSPYESSEPRNFPGVPDPRVSRLCKIIMECQSLHGFEFQVNPIYTLFILCKASPAFEKTFWREVDEGDSSYRRTFIVLRNPAIWTLFFPTLRKHIALLTKWDFTSAEGRKRILSTIWSDIKALYNKVCGKYYLIIALARVTGIVYTVATTFKMLEGFIYDRSLKARYDDANMQIERGYPPVGGFFDPKNATLLQFMRKYKMKHYAVTPLTGGTLFKKEAWLEPHMVEVLVGKYCLVDDTEEYLENWTKDGRFVRELPPDCFTGDVNQTVVFPEGHNYESGRVNAGRHLRATKVHRVEKPASGQAEKQMDDEALTAISTKIISKNTYSLYKCVDDETNGYVGMIIFVGPKVAMIPLHYVTTYRRQYNEGSRFELAIEQSDVSVAYMMTVKQFLDHAYATPQLAAHDVCLVNLGFIKQLPCHTDITKHFVKSDAKVLEFRNIDLLLSVPREFTTNQWFTKGTILSGYGIGDGAHSYTIGRSVKYECRTAKGDCGSLVYINNKYNSAGKILGMHVAGRPDIQTGIACVITREMVEEALKDAQSGKTNGFEVSARPPVLEYSQIEKQMGNNFLPFEGNYEFVRTTSLAVRSPPYTQIMRSNMYGIFGPSYRAPARLKPFIMDGVPINPLNVAIARYGTPTHVFSAKAWKCMLFASTEEAAYCANQSVHAPKLGLLNIREAIMGIPEVSYCTSIPRKTSAGWPYSVTKPGGKTGKYHFFGEGDDYDLDTDNFAQLEVEVLAAWEKLANGEEPEFVFTDILKDELLKHEKVRTGKTRLISGCPLVLLIITRMLFMGWVQWMMENHVCNGTAPGINVYSQMWDSLYKVLTSKSDLVIPTDISGLDTSEVYEVFKLILDHDVQPFYKDGYYNMRLTIIKMLAHSHHICDDIIYKWPKNMPSGAFLTTPFNTKYTLKCIRAAYYYISDMPYGTFDQHVSAIVYGDDSVVNVSRDISDRFNFHSLVEGMAAMGLKVTSDDKNDVNPPAFKSVQVAGFLKRSFRFEPLLQSMVAPLELKVILDMINWTKRGMMAKTITESNVENCLIELSLHEPTVFDKYSPTLISESRIRLGYTPIHVNRASNIDFIIGELASA